MVSDGLGEPIGEIGVVGVESQERPYRPQEVLDVPGLGLLTAAGVGFLALGVTISGPLGLQFGTNPFDGRC